MDEPNQYMEIVYYIHTRSIWGFSREIMVLMEIMEIMEKIMEYNGELLLLLFPLFLGI